MRVAFYGGSFNPPHVAHAMVSAWLLWSDQVDEVWLVPVYRHAFEGTQDKVLAPFAERVGWCRAMAKDVDPRIRVRTVESELPVPSFTIDTLNHLALKNPGHEFRLVVGADVLEQVDGWKDWAGICTHYSPIVVGRVGSAKVDDVPEFPGLSSTELRARLRREESVAGLVTSTVAKLLVTHPWS